MNLLPHWGVMQIYRWEPLTVCHHPGKSCKYKHCDSGDLVFLVWNVTLREHVFKGLCKFMGGSLPWRVRTSPCLVYCKWWYKVFNLSHDLTKPRDWTIIKLFESELFMEWHHLPRFGYRYCGSRDVFSLSPDLARPRDQQVRWVYQ